MKKSTVTKALLLFLIFSLNIFSEKLELNLTKDSTYLQCISASSVISQNIGGQAFDMTMGITGLTAFEIKSVENSVYQMDVYYKELGISVDFFGSSMEFNSLKDDINDMTSKILKNMTNQKFSLKMNKTGKVLEIKGVDNLYSNLFTGVEGISQEEKDQITDQMKNSFGEESFKSNIEMAAPAFPEKNVKVGEQWTVNTKVNSGFTLNVNSNYTLKEVTKDSYILEVVSTISTGDEFNEMNGMFVKYDLDGTMNSVITIDKKTGWTTTAKVAQKLGGKTFTKFSADDSEIIESPLDMKTDMTISNK